MPKDNSIHSVLIIGSGPIIIGQACEFDYSGTQAARSLKEEGIEVTLINSNPATIMTDKVTADNIYLKPLTKRSIIEIERSNGSEKSPNTFRDGTERWPRRTGRHQRMKTNGMSQ